MDLRDWIGRTESAEDIITATPVAALSATLDRPPARPAAGTPLPPLWHWLYFLPLARLSDIGPDGHPRRGGFLPPVPLPRRMWAGSQFQFHGPLDVGDEIARLSTIEDVTEKTGRSGTLVFVRVRHEIRRRGAEALAITEHHDIVYRDAPRPGEPPSPAKAAPATPPWRKRWTPDDVLLFRYSALTFNGHRIHYDRRYVTEVEGYPGLVVHGPLLATLMLDLVHDRLPEAEVAAYEFRALRPTFDIAPFEACGAPSQDGRSVSLWIQDLQGNLAMTATATLR
jgi:3-methylfumaryl-CoA hydratase